MKIEMRVSAEEKAKIKELAGTRTITEFVLDRCLKEPSKPVSAPFMDRPQVEVCFEYAPMGTSVAWFDGVLGMVRGLVEKAHDAETRTEIAGIERILAEKREVVAGMGDKAVTGVGIEELKQRLNLKPGSAMKAPVTIKDWV